MQVAAHRPKEIFGGFEGLVFLRAEHVFGHKIRDVINREDMFRDPEQGVQIAQPAFAFFHIGFDHIAQALLFVADRAFVQFGLNELGARACEQVFAEGLSQFSLKPRVARDKAAFQKGGLDGVVIMAQAHTVLDGAGRVADLHL